MRNFSGALRVQHFVNYFDYLQSLKLKIKLKREMKVISFEYLHLNRITRYLFWHIDRIQELHILQ